MGFERLAALIGQEKTALVLDVGDTFHGQAFATLEQGASMAELLKAVKYDAMTPGNHDWNYGKERLKELEQLSGIRIGKLLPAGDITVGDIVDIAPFGNYIVMKEISGEAVRSILEKSIDIGLENKKAYDEWKETSSDKVRWPDDNGNYLQFGGMDVQYDTTKPLGQRVVSVQVGDAPLNPQQLYTVATNNYISLGKTYSELADVPELNQYAACDEALISCIGQGQAWMNAAANKACLEEAIADSLPQAENAT